MDEFYNIRNNLKIIVEDTIHNAMAEYIQSQPQDLENFLLYPLINIEMGLVNDVPESLENEARRDRLAFLVLMTTPHRNTLPYSTNTNRKGYENFKNISYKKLGKIYNDFRTLLEIKDGSSYAKSLLAEMRQGEYSFITSLVSEKYSEESFYYYGMDNPEEFEENAQFTERNIREMMIKYGRKYPQKIKRLLIDIDNQIFMYSTAQVTRDIRRLPNKVKSAAFDNVDSLVGVLGFLHYMGMVKRLQYLTSGPEHYIENCLIDVDKDWLIAKINKVTAVNIDCVKKIIHYLTNDGMEHILEFPLFEHEGHIITAPSLLVVNDWQFSLVNGHYFKNVEFKRREKTISVSTQEKLKALLNNVQNIVFKEEHYYEFEEDGKKINSDIDFAMYDKLSNTMLVIEAKWRDNHYVSTNEKQYKKIQDTFQKAHKDQIEKHKKYLQTLKSPLLIFDEYSEMNIPQADNPQMFYIAVDKRNQLHIDGKHMITEFMLLAFLNDEVQDNKLSLEKVVKKIWELQTKVEYIAIPPQKEILLPDGSLVFGDECDFQLNYPQGKPQGNAKM